MKKYRQLSLNERENLYILLQEGKDMKAIASKLERDQSTIYRELKRNKANKELGYLPNKAHEKAQARVARHGNKISQEFLRLIENQT